MSDTAPSPAAGSAPETGAPPAGTAAPPSLTESYTGIPETFASDPDFQSFKTFDELASDYKTLKALHTNREQNGLVEFIGETSTPEQINSFFEKLGKPKAAAEYDLKAPEGLPEGLNYSDEMTAKFAEVAHSVNLTKDQASKLWEFYNGYAVESFQSHAAAKEQAIAENVKALEQAWGGDPESENFRKNHQNAMRAFNVAADPALAEAFKSDPELASNPHVLLLLSRLGAKMSPDSVPTVSSSAPTGNFSESVEGIEKQIQEFVSSGKFKEAINGSGPQAQQYYREYQALQAKKMELQLKG